MTSHYLEKIPTHFDFSPLPEGLPAEREAIVVIAEVANIKAVELPFHELQRAEVISHQPSRDRYLAARYLLRGTLSQWLGIKSQEVPIVIDPTGKPFLSMHGVQFSISHTEKIMALSFSFFPASGDPLPVGIDIERERLLDVSALARRFFSPAEAEMLQRTQSLSEFFRLWCCREAAIKADGRGLGELLASTQVILQRDPDVDCSQVMVRGVSWSAYHWILRDEVHGAVAFLKPPSVIHWCDLREPLG